MIDLLVPTTAQGLLWAVMACGVDITYTFLAIRRPRIIFK